MTLSVEANGINAIISHGNLSVGGYAFLAIKDELKIAGWMKAESPEAMKIFNERGFNADCNGFVPILKGSQYNLDKVKVEGILP